MKCIIVVYEGTRDTETGSFVKRGETPSQISYTYTKDIQEARIFNDPQHAINSIKKRNDAYSVYGGKFALIPVDVVEPDPVPPPPQIIPLY